MKLNGKRHFEIPKKRIPKRADPGRCQGTTSHGKDKDAEWLTVSDSTCDMFDTALAWLCLQDAVRLVPDKSGVFWCWQFCKKFIAACAQLGPSATVDRMAVVSTRVLVRGRQIIIKFPAFFKELEDSWRPEVSNFMASAGCFWSCFHAAQTGALCCLCV